MSDYPRICIGCQTTCDVYRNGYCSDCDAAREQIKETATTFINQELYRLKAKQTKEVKPPVLNKPPISLIPREAIFEMAKSFDYGTGKHGRYAFRDGVHFTKLIDAAMRHLLAITDGEDIDEESQTLHAACAMSNLSMLIFMMRNKQEFDDRWKK